MQYRCDATLDSRGVREKRMGVSCFWRSEEEGSIRLVIDFRRLNANLVRQEYPLSTTEEILTSVHGFSFATSLDLNMGYLSIQVNDATWEILR